MRIRRLTGSLKVHDLFIPVIFVTGPKVFLLAAFEWGMCGRILRNRFDDLAGRACEVLPLRNRRKSSLLPYSISSLDFGASFFNVKHLDAQNVNFVSRSKSSALYALVYLVRIRWRSLMAGPYCTPIQFVIERLANYELATPNKP